MIVDEIRRALRDAGLERLANQVEQLVLPAIRIDAQPVNEDELPVGASKLGGRPDLPPGVAWPERDGQPLGFLAQFNLAEVAPYDVEHALPPTGMLYFFYDFVRQPWGLEPAQRGGWRAMYRNAPSSTLVRTPVPEGVPSKADLKPLALALSVSQTLASDMAFKWQFDLSRDEAKRFGELSYAMGLRMQILGHPNYIHYTEMPTYCEVISSGGTFDDLPRAFISFCQEPDAQDEAALIQAARNWRLLFQLGALPGTDFASAPRDEDGIPDVSYYSAWGRNGILYFWIERDRLAKRDFSNVWLLGASEF